VTLDVNGSGKLFIKSQVNDYALRGEALSTSNVMDFFVNTYEADIDKSSWKQATSTPAMDNQVDLMRGPRQRRRGRPLHERVHYLESHPKYKSKYRIVRDRHHNTLPNFIGRYFPSRDDEDQQSFYFASMLSLLKPWRNLRTDLKRVDQTWEEAFDEFCSTASPRELRIISNIQYFHNCEAAAQREAFKPIETQIPGSRDLVSEDLDEDEDVPYPMDDGKFTEDGLAFSLPRKNPGVKNCMHV